MSASRPRIALYLPSLSGGGAERVFVQLANEFAAQGFRVDLVLAAARGPYLTEVSSDVRIVDLGGSGVMRSLPSLMRYLRKDRPAVLLSALEHSNIVAWLAQRLSRVPARCVVSIRSVPSAVYERDKSWSRWLILQIAARVYRRADAVIANSSFAAADLEAAMGVSPERLVAIHNPLDIAGIEVLSRAPIPEPWVAKMRYPLVLGVGSLTVLKDFATLLRAFSLVRAQRECRLAILGEGSHRQALEAMIRELAIGRDVCLPGFVSNPYAWMHRAAVFVSSSLTEGCPNALMQAMACGTPVVSTDCPGGAAEILEKGRWGKLVPVGDASAMARAILETLDAHSRPNVLERARAFDLQATAARYLQVLLPARAPGAGAA